ncbi:transmembrane protein 45B-like protein [Dinothrombium tinctorium]|uniref:Transmembrane protein 45B-like protein n=1 Tax=Dinothrombium tinctorium TaxID=1965070 RepID=A0A443QQF7_9ACAR|nr:transmembrane protein 45B-like protein [Dinothrombium tinctorium]RWS05316.1 transmembrane protein 45B-like protein [Dinothrombium tinctorium]
MGTFLGHVVPGTFFILIGLRWLFLTVDQYFKSLSRKQYSQDCSFRCTATYRCSLCPNKPAEGYFKIVSAAIGMIGEIYTAFEDGKFTSMGNTQHTTMYLFFGLNGFVDVLLFYGLYVPKGSDYLTMALACFVEALLFFFHLHGRTSLDIIVHQLLLVAIVASFAASLIEWKNRSNVLSALFRSICTLLQGTWFYQVGFILYNPLPGAVKWDPESHPQIMLVTAIFCWHIAGIILLTGFFGFVCWFRHSPVYTQNAKVNGGSDQYLHAMYEVCDSEVAMESLLPVSKHEKPQNNRNPSHVMNGTISTKVINEDDEDF